MLRLLPENSLESYMLCSLHNLWSQCDWCLPILSRSGSWWLGLVYNNLAKTTTFLSCWNTYNSQGNEIVNEISLSKCQFMDLCYFWAGNVESSSIDQKFGNLFYLRLFINSRNTDSNQPMASISQRYNMSLSSIVLNTTPIIVGPATIQNIECQIWNLYLVFILD